MEVAEYVRWFPSSLVVSYKYFPDAVPRLVLNCCDNLGGKLEILKSDVTNVKVAFDNNLQSLVVYYKKGLETTFFTYKSTVVTGQGKSLFCNQDFLPNIVNKCNTFYLNVTYDTPAEQMAKMYI
jgi:hypothetical protein